MVLACGLELILLWKLGVLILASLGVGGAVAVATQPEETPSE